MHPDWQVFTHSKHETRASLGLGHPVVADDARRRLMAGSWPLAEPRRRRSASNDDGASTSCLFRSGAREVHPQEGASLHYGVLDVLPLLSLAGWASLFLAVRNLVSWPSRSHFGLLRVSPSVSRTRRASLGHARW